VDDHALSRAARRFWSLGADVFALEGATAVRSPAAPGHPLGTFLCEVRDADPAAVLAGFARRTGAPCPRVLVDPATPPASEAHLALRGWQLEIALQLVLPADAAVAAPVGTVRPVTDDAGWAHVHRLFRIDHIEEDARLTRPVRSDADTAVAVALRRSLGVTYLLAERSGSVAGCIASWPGDEGIGMVEDVFVHPDHRRRGVATDLLRHAVGYARARGAGPVLIGAEVDDTPKHLYARFGFRPSAVVRSYEAPPA
jgi:GNAT superfamily N-acetyltransferase